jgi:hypothetical protein
MMLKGKIFFLFLCVTYSLIAQNTVPISQVSAFEFAKQNPQALVIQCTKEHSFHFTPYPLYQEHAAARFPSEGLFKDIYIVSVPNSTAYFHHYNLWGINGLIFINNYWIEENQIKNISPFCLNNISTIEVPAAKSVYQKQGTVAICSHLYPECYGHFILDVLCQLALLELHAIEYDYLCIPYNQKFMREALELWGVKQEKIIPLQFDQAIMADKIVMPTAVTQTKNLIPNANYTVDFLIKYVRNKLLQPAREKASGHTFSKKIFISRKDANSKRVVPNEDELFQAFKQHGFERYELTKLSLAEQIVLFNNAEEVVSFAGSGAINTIFCNPKTKYIELIQTMVDATFYFLADIFSLDYRSINNSTERDLSNGPCTTASYFPITLVETFLKEYQN